MYNFPIGIITDSFRTTAAEAIKKAAKCGANGVQMYATRGELAPETMTAEKLSEIRNLLADNGLKVSALCGDLGRGFGNAELNPGLIEKSKRILELAKEFGTNIVTTHIGVVPEDSNHERYKIMQAACYELAEFADSMGSHFAVETGPETPEILKGFLDSLGSKGVAVNYDPANIVMVTKADPVKGVYTLKDYIVHTHAKDGINIYYKNPELVYRVIPHIVEDENPEHTGPSYREVPLGTGSVDFKNLLKAYEEIGYKGFLTIEREVGDDPAKDIVTAAEYLRNIIAEN
ncbi:MAG: sugar phosphate isomerase/epimerase [Ruminococcaceae bacterium]|nr:sugar phosphate isomerase/epimerase [Oscillospiraceae bacterium]